MARRPDLGYFEDGVDLADAGTYASAARQYGKATVLPAVAHRSIAFDYLEDEALWSRAWVAIGTLRDIPNPDDILPYTLGYHGIHVQRMPDGTLRGRFNMAQHGGCRMVPDQCQNGTKTNCSFTSCGYSRDRGPIDAEEERATPRLSHQYLGLRPERLLPVQVAERGGLILVSLDRSAPPPDFGPVALQQGSHATGKWAEVPANWKLVAASLARCDNVTARSENRLDGTRENSGVKVTWLHPNAVILTAHNIQCLLIVQPTATCKTLMRISFFGQGAGLDAFWHSQIEQASALATKHQSAQGGSSVPAPARQTDAVAHWGQNALINRIATMPRTIIDTPMMQPTRSYMR